MVETERIHHGVQEIGGDLMMFCKQKSHEIHEEAQPKQPKAKIQVLVGESQDFRWCHFL